MRSVIAILAKVAVVVLFLVWAEWRLVEHAALARLGNRRHHIVAVHSLVAGLGNLSRDLAHLDIVCSPAIHNVGCLVLPPVKKLQELNADLAPSFHTGSNVALVELEALRDVVLGEVLRRLFSGVRGDLRQVARDIRGTFKKPRHSIVLLLPMVVQERVLCIGQNALRVAAGNLKSLVELLFLGVRKGLRRCRIKRLVQGCCLPVKLRIDIDWPLRWGRH